MNVLNRLIVLLIALLLVAVPVLLLLVHFGVISVGLANTYTGYQAGLDALGSLSSSTFSTRARTIIGIAGGLVALIALLLVMRELNPGRRAARNATIRDTPGQEIRITASAVRSLSEAAARDAGASSSSVALRSSRRAYTIICGLQAPQESNRAQLAARAGENIREALESQNVPVKEVEITVQGTTS